MGLGIIIPLVLVAIVVPIAFTLAKRYLKDGAASGVDEPVITPSTRLTSNALRELPTPTWRVVYEIAPEKLGGPAHVLVGPPGIFAVQTSMDPIPVAPPAEHDPHTIAGAAIARGGLDDALRRCAMSSDQLLTIHWGAPVEGSPVAVDTVPGAIAVDGRSVARWAERAIEHTIEGVTAGSTREPLSQSQIDLAWQTVTVAIGRPDPLK